MSLRTVADDTSTPGVPVMWADPTGSAVSMYSDTTAVRMAALRGSSSSSSPTGAVTCSSTGRGPGAGRAGRAVRFGTMRVLALDCSECYFGDIDRALEGPPSPPVPRATGSSGGPGGLDGGPGRAATSPG